MGDDTLVIGTRHGKLEHSTQIGHHSHKPHVGCGRDQRPDLFTTATTVIARMRRSVLKLMLRRYAMSSRNRSSKLITPRPVICHSPVSPGRTSKRAVCHKS